MNSIISASLPSGSRYALGKGKQRAEPQHHETAAAESNRVDASLDIVDCTIHTQSYLPGCPGSSTNFALVNPHFIKTSDIAFSIFEENNMGNSLFNASEQVIRATDERSTKMADREAGLEKLKKACQSERLTISTLGEESPGNYSVHFLIEAGDSEHAAFLSGRIQEALHILDAMCLTIDIMLHDSEKTMSELLPLLKHIEGEIAALKKSLPTPARAFLGVIFFAAVLIPLVILIWSNLTSLKLISANAVLPKAIAGGICVVGVIAGILKSWPDYKNARAEDASSSTRQLIQCYETIYSAHDDLKQKIEASKINQAADQSRNAALASAFYGSHNFAKVHDIQQQLAKAQEQLAIQNELLRQFMALHENVSAPHKLEAGISQLEEQPTNRNELKPVNTIIDKFKFRTPRGNKRSTV